jgi:hypothetical protein
MFKVGIKGLDEAIKVIDKTQRQIKFATAKALTRTAVRIQEAETRAIEKSFDRPISFTKRAIGIAPATTANLEARVFVKDRQAKYLEPQIMGGSRGIKTFERRFNSKGGSGGYWVPGPGVKLNASGNIPLNTIKQIALQLQLAGAKSGLFQTVFIGRPKNQPNKPFAIWAKDKKGKLVPMLIRLDKSPTYRRRFDFYGIGNRLKGQVFNEEFNRAMREALNDIAEHQLKRAVKSFL